MVFLAGVLAGFLVFLAGVLAGFVVFLAGVLAGFLAFLAGVLAGRLLEKFLPWEVPELVGHWPAQDYRRAKSGSRAYTNPLGLNVKMHLKIIQKVQPR